jgi:signal transduction histidine kinase
VENLLENGVRHNRPGGWVAAGTASGPRGEAMLEVSNSGPRIEPAAVRRLTEPFERLGRRSDGRGAGLGLSIVRSVVDAHGGELAITAREAGGLAVRVTFPRPGS